MAAIKTPARIGWIGMGKMGLPICMRLRGAGFQVTALCRSAAAEAVAAGNGFDVARTIADVAKGADVVASAISDDKAFLEVAIGAGGLKDRLSRRQVYLDASTVSPAASARAADALSPLGCAYLRAPVSGSTAMAAQGALTAMVSGPFDAFRDLEAFFAAFTKKAFLVGPGEEARTLKLSINAMVGATSALLAEALMLARKGGMDIETIMAVVAESAIASPLIQYKKGAVTSGDYKAAFSVSQMLKDFDLIEQAAAAASCRLPLISHIRTMYQDAVEQGLGDQDFFVLTAADASRAKGAK